MQQSTVIITLTEMIDIFVSSALVISSIKWLIIKRLAFKVKYICKYIHTYECDNPTIVQLRNWTCGPIIMKATTLHWN